MARALRPLSDDLQARLIEYLQTGVHRQTAAAACSVSETELRAWIERGGKDELAGRTSRYSRFRTEVLRVEAETQALVVGQLVAAAQRGEFKAAEAYLVRRWPRLWGYAQKLRLEIEIERKKVILLAKAVLCKRCLGKFIDALCEQDQDDEGSQDSG